MRILVIILVVFLTGCKVTKDKTRENTKISNDIIKTEDVVTKRYREGGHVSSVITTLYKLKKDSVIVKKHGSATQTIIYKKDGTAEVKSDCAEILEQQHQKIKTIDQTLSEIQKRTKHKEESVSPKVMLYFMIGLVAITIFALWYVTWSIKKQFKLLTPTT